MIGDLETVRSGLDATADAIVVGSGAGGAVAAANLAAAGMRTIVLEAGPRVRPEDMTRDGPRFFARYLWEGGLRMIGGSAQVPAMMGRCLGGSTVMNSAIMMRLPGWVREEWAEDEGLAFMLDPAIDRSFDRVMARTGVTATPMSVMGPRNLLARDALAAMGIEGAPLPRAVVGCEGCNDCITGCFAGKKRSVDLSWIPGAVAAGADVYTHCQAERILVDGGRAVGVSGVVVDPDGWQEVARFEVRAPIVVLAAGVIADPGVLQASGINPRGQVGRGYTMHITGGVVGVFEQPTYPWIGATQGYGAISEEIRGLKYETLWAPPNLITARWGGLGDRFYAAMEEIGHAAVIACVCRAETRGKVTPKGAGRAKIRLHIPQDQLRPLLRGLKTAVDGFLAVGARHVYSGIASVRERFTSRDQTGELLDPKIRPSHMGMTGNHSFGTCRMSADPSRGPVDPQGRMRGVEGLYVTDTSIFPTPSAVNPQATAMMLADVISRRIGELEL